MTGDLDVQEATRAEQEPVARVARAAAIRRRIQSVGIGAVFVVIVVTFTALTDQFFTSSNAINILAGAAVIGIVAIGQTLAIVSGGFDLSVGGTVPLGSVLFAIWVNAGYGLPLSILLVLLIGGVVGLVNGLVISKVGVNPLITTLATLSITGGLAFTITGGQTKTFDNPSDGLLANPTLGSIPNYVWLLLVLSLLGHGFLKYTVPGRIIYSLGGNREASWLAGVRVDAMTTFVYVVCGALSGFAGAILASQLLAGSGNLGVTSSLVSISAVILGGASLSGGVGGMPGTLIGVLVLGVLANGLTLLQVSPFYQQIATGVVLLLAVAFGRLRAGLNSE